MNFGDAIAAMKQGKLVQRAGWNGKGMHVYLEDMFSFPIRGGIYKGTARTYEPTLVLYTGKDTHQPGWNASTPDVLAEDWAVVDG